MNRIELKSRKLLRKIFGGISLTAMAFVFQSCYGMPSDSEWLDEVKLTGTVKAKTTNLPIKGISISVNDGFSYYGITDDEGKFMFYADVPHQSYQSDKDGEYYTPNNVKVRFRDVDGIENGWFADTTITINPVGKNEIRIDMVLEEKQ